MTNSKKKKLAKLFYEISDPEEMKKELYVFMTELIDIREDLNNVNSNFKDKAAVLQSGINTVSGLKDELMQIISKTEKTLGNRLENIAGKNLQEKIGKRLTEYEKNNLKELNNFRRMILELTQRGGSIYPSFQEEFPIETTPGLSIYHFPHAVNKISLGGIWYSVLNGDYTQQGAYQITLTNTDSQNLPINNYF